MTWAERIGLFFVLLGPAIWIGAVGVLISTLREHRAERRRLRRIERQRNA